MSQQSVSIRNYGRFIVQPQRYIQPNEELGTFVVVVYVRDNERPAKGGVGETSGAAIVSSELGT